ncbi:MAG: HYR domain-containing protein [Acidobacteria bacterium]|nr:HYR domain-containing protein [Acidobacteriota bacterium]
MLPKTAQPLWQVRTEKVERLPLRQDVQIFRVLVSSPPCSSLIYFDPVRIRLIPKITVRGQIVLLPAVSFTPRRRLLQMKLICPTAAVPGLRFYIYAKLIPCSHSVSLADLTASVQVDGVCGPRQVINKPADPVLFDQTYDFLWLSPNILQARGFVYGNRLVAPIETSPCMIEVGTLMLDIQCPGPQTLSAGSGCTALFDAPAIALDSCGGLIAITSDPPVPAIFGLGTHTVTYIATDAHGNTATCTTMVIVLNNGPTANAGGDQDIHTTELGLTVTLNGTGSVDPNGQPLTYFWEQTSGPAIGFYTNFQRAEGCK